MANNISHVELEDTFNSQRERINSIIDVVNGLQTITPGDGLEMDSSSVLSVKAVGDGLTFDNDGALVGNDAYPNLITQVVIDPNSTIPAPTSVTELGISFPAFRVIFGNKMYYGNKISDFTVVDVEPTTVYVEAGSNGAVYVYVDNSGEIHQTMTSISPSNSTVQCLLGSYFRLSNKIQAGSWKYTPWNGATSKDMRFADNTSISGGLLHASSANTLSRNSVTILKEGVNIAADVYNPNVITYTYEDPYMTKALWNGYDPSVAPSSTLDTTHIYNITSGQVDDISGKEGYIVLIPGIVSVTGQDVYLMAMSTKDGNEYPQIYPTIEEASRNIYGMDIAISNVASRVAWLGQSIIVKIGATDYTDISQLQIVGEVPNILGNFSNTPGYSQPIQVEGLTIKAASVIVGEAETKNSINFKSGFVVQNDSENEVGVHFDTSLLPVKASSNEIEQGTIDNKFVTPLGLKSQTYLATVNKVESILQQNQSTTWPTSSSVDVWPHTVVITATSNHSISSVQPTYTDKILTWEVVIKNTGTNSISISWPASYKGFNGEDLLDTLEGGTAAFMIMRKYTNTYALVSLQGIQAIAEM